MTTTHRQPSEPKPADVLVVFGISSDLAKVMTFRSLYRLERRGLLTCPIVGVGQSARFIRQDSVEETWRVLQPLLDAPPLVHPYAKGSWGPSAADQLVASYGGWRGPWVTP